MGRERALTNFAGLDRKRSRSLRLIEMLLESAKNQGRLSQPGS
jgi:hypothetical protein